MISRALAAASYGRLTPLQPLVNEAAALLPLERERDYLHIAATAGAEPRVTVADIKLAVAAHYGLPPIEMVSSRRSRSVAWPRQVAMYLARQLTPRSFPEIGRAFGNRDHSTVVHAIKMVEQRLIGGDADLASAIDAIQADVRRRAAERAGEVQE